VIALLYLFQYRRPMSHDADLLMVISDLDGTLLDSNDYSFTAAATALEALRRRAGCLVLASSKTRAEMEPIRLRLSHEGPFIVENGGALYIPRGLFYVSPEEALSRGDYAIIQFGTPYTTLRAALKDIAVALATELKGFGDLSGEEVMELTGLNRREAMLAKQREYDEPFVLSHAGLIESVRREAAVRGLTCTQGGRFYHLLGQHDKGDACRFLLQGCRGQRAARQGRVYSIGIGDSANDLPMLAAVDLPILVQRPDGSYDSTVQLPNLIRAPGIGPVGWNTAVLHVLGTPPT
jgi:mannosyl-3-phosphoglycerate phosphatase